MKCDSWDQVEFGDLYSVPSKNGLTKPKSLRGNGVRFLNMGELFAYNRISDEPMDKAPITQREAMSYLLTKGDLLFARQSLVLSGTGKCSIIVDCKKDTTFDSHIIRIRLDQTKAFSLFYYYFFHSHYGRSQVLSTASQVAAAGIRGSDLAKIKVAYPPLPEQHAIAATLSCLDDKIELNTRMNKTLEEMAQAIFKSWFVDFEPFQDDEFVDSELGRIPKGWRVGTLGEIASITTGKRPSERVEKADLEHSIPVAGASGIMAYTRESQTDGDVIITGRVGTHGILQRYSQPIWVSDNAFIFKSSYLEYTYQALSCVDFASLNVGSTQPLITQTALRSVKVLVPSSVILSDYESLANNFYIMTASYRKQNEQLATIRDSLLPKLMNGEIRVPTNP